MGCTKGPPPVVSKKGSPPGAEVTSEASGVGLFSTGLWGNGDGVEATAWSGGDDDYDPHSASAIPPTREPLSGRRKRRRKPPLDGRSGPRIGVTKAGPVRRDLAWNDTFRSVAAAQTSRRQGSALAISIALDELLRRRRARPVARLILFTVDISGSMAGELTKLAKSMALTALREAYLARDRVAMIAFRERSAEVLFEPTNQQELVSRAFDDLPVGGTTPLAAGLELSLRVLHRHEHRRSGLDPTLVLISDGRANVGARRGYEAILSELNGAARALARVKNLETIMLDTTAAGKNDFPAKQLATELAARRLELWRLGSTQWDATAAWNRVLAPIRR